MVSTVIPEGQSLGNKNAQHLHSIGKRRGPKIALPMGEQSLTEFE
jgi:hypothetical protein